MRVDRKGSFVLVVGLQRSLDAQDGVFSPGTRARPRKVSRSAVDGAGQFSRNSSTT